MSYFPKTSQPYYDGDLAINNQKPITSSSGVIPIGQTIPDVNLESLLAVIRLLDTSNGILNVKSVYHDWTLVLQQGNLVLIEEQDQFIPTLVRKLQSQKIKSSYLHELGKKPSDELNIYQKISSLFELEPESLRQVIKEILFENLLALQIENKFSIVWQPLSSLALLKFPVWQLSILEETAIRASEQWRSFTYVHHPFQRVQLLDDEDTLAHVPLFAKVTRGQHRISEIADKFKQSLSRTALHLDKLAEKRTVAILPLTPQIQNESNISDRHNNQIVVPEAPKIFVVDDSPVLIKQFGELLKSWGYQVSVSQDATNATQKILECSPTVIFLDINMPGMNGFELIKKIRRQPSLFSTPIVLVTAENSMANSFRAKWAHCRFLAKPRSVTDTQEFRELLRNLLREIAPLPTDPLV